MFIMKLVLAHNSLPFIHLIGLSKRVNMYLIYMQIYADIIKSSGLDLLIEFLNLAFKLRFTDLLVSNKIYNKSTH
jgi:hypothetical protein